ncbi:hypothetical protein AAY81_04025 [Denitrobacterium detoxificans]|uniref:Uncharacterized protein n=1 Tax=Denitrobacterium detoxificans TaxID=79604 RepID=A0A172RXI0_9ACTN|nr:hypothetical protein AAY81_04025 [Denitrobacterium detoxificans]SEO81733.1 hypothetical protein SAMN02910314_01305 [Denitrobacterium detoxificans]SEP01691.1 hypothetical protein SAMN02910314_01929 [Denitrobacterium detoxificans]
MHCKVKDRECEGGTAERYDEGCRCPAACRAHKREYCRRWNREHAEERRERNRRWMEWARHGRWEA